jgi:UDP-N-acetylmuramoyl-L-alanyl-D-glutamate--2,6-diaminopimelate ligase
MKLKALLKGLKCEVKGSKDVDISGISADSRTAFPGSLFIARKGTATDGTEFIPQALNAGSSAIVTDLYDPFLKTTQVIVSNPKDVEAQLACRFYGDPSESMFVVGVTGTKGKTTTSYMTHHLLTGLKGCAGLSSTVETIIGDETRHSILTTHCAIQNQKNLKEMVLRGCKAAVIEVSSHGLDQGRVDEISFAVGIFTNLYPDHLDYHKDIDDYANAKKKLFAKVRERALINGDSPWGSSMKGSCLNWTFGIEAKADIMAHTIQFNEQGTSFLVTFQEQAERFQIPLMGRFNVYNALGTIGVGLHVGATLKEIASILATFPSVPGRLEKVPNARGVWVFVDFSHSGPALENVLSTLREVAHKKIICVFGAGGNRDPLRRTQMAEAAEKFADIVIVTSDNPRNEDPQRICEQILAAFQTPAKVELILNRKEAIERAIFLAQKDDIVLIAGKGHEKVQIFANQTIPFDDVQVAAKAFDNSIQYNKSKPLSF